MNIMNSEGHSSLHATEVLPGGASSTSPSDSIITSAPILKAPERKSLNIEVGESGIAKWSLYGPWTYTEILGQLEAIKIQIASSTLRQQEETI